jgi:hypothetical protein
MNDKLDWAIAVFDALRDLDHPDLYFQCNLHLSRITSDFAKSMRRAGCWLCNVGLESGSQRVLDGIKKKTKLTEVETRLQTLKDQGVKVYAFMMMYQLWESDRGLEIETTREVFQSIRLVLSLWCKRLLNQMSWAYATPYPGSELYRICKRRGLLPRNFDESLVSSDLITIPIPGLSKVEIMTARLAGLLTQLLLNMSNRERYEPHALIPNAKHAIVKLRQLLIDFRKPIAEHKSAPSISRSKSPQILGGTADLQPIGRYLGGQQSVSTLVQIEKRTI